MAASDWIGFLDYSPEAAYYSSPMGQEFSLPFRSYLDPEEGDNPFTSRYTQTYKSLAPSARGSYTGAYAPRTRQIYF